MRTGLVRALHRGFFELKHIFENRESISLLHKQKLAPFLGIQYR